MKAIRVSEYGGPSVLKLEEIPSPQPGPGVKTSLFIATFRDLFATPRLPGRALPALPIQ